MENQNQEQNNFTVYEHITPDGMYYFGITTDVEKRWAYNGGNYKKTTLEPYIKKYGWENIQHQVLFTNQTEKNARWIENFLIRTAKEDGVCINKHRSGFVSKNPAYHRNYRKMQYQNHREEIIAYQKRYSQKKKDLKTLNELGYIPLF